MEISFICKYRLYPKDINILNSEKLAEIYNCSEADALYYMYHFCRDDNNITLCKRLFVLYHTTSLGSGEKNYTQSEKEEYDEGIRKLLNSFDVAINDGKALAIEKKARFYNHNSIIVLAHIF